MPQFQRTSHFSFLLWVTTLVCQFAFHFQVSGATSIIDTTSGSFSSTQGITLPISTTSLSALSGLSVGDFNGDGYEDILIALQSGSYGSLTSCGILYVVFGTATGIPSIDPSTMASSQGIRITGPASNALLGYSVDALRDVNGDLIDDIILGTYSGNKAYVIFGKKNGQLRNIDLSTTDISATNQGIVIVGPHNIILVSSAGDFNDDGINDFIVSFPIALAGQGLIYVIFGQSSISTSFDLNIPLPLSQGVQIVGKTNIQLGRSLSKAGDINNDGIDDIMIGTDTPTGGMVALIYGTKIPTSTIQVNTFPSNQGVIITGSGSRIGILGTIGRAGDLNNDNIDDVALGVPLFSASPARSSGKVYVIYGKNGGFSNNINLASSFDGFQIKGEAQSQWQFGRSITSADINRDGLSDLMIGCPGVTTTKGIVYVIFGNKKGLFDIDLANQGSQLPQVLKIYGNSLEDSLGFNVRSAKDFNKDGVNDLLISGKLNAYTIYGNNCGSVTHCSSSSLSPICYASKGCACGDYQLYFQENVCVSQCSQGYYLDTPICEACPFGCASCTSASSCQTCIEDFVLEGTLCEPACPIGYHLEETICQSNDISGLSEAQTIGSITDVTQKAGSGTLTAASLISPNDPGSVTASMLAKMLQYIRYINIPYSQRLELTFKNHNSTYGPFGIGPKMPQEMLFGVPFHYIPYRFIKYHVHSSFLINFWDSMIFLAIIFSVLLLIRLVEWSATKIQQKSKSYLIIQAARAAVQNFLIMQFYNVIGDILLFLTLDLKEVMLVNSEAVFSLCLSILFLLIGCILLVWHIYVLLRLRKLRRSNPSISNIEELSEKYQGSTVLFIPFTANTFLAQSFLLLFVIRNCLFNLVLALISGSPLVQAILILIMSVLLLLFLLFQRPFKSLINMLQHISCEIFLLIVNVCVLILAQINYEKEGSYQLRDRLCEVIIYTSLVFGFVPQAFLVLKITVMGIDHYKRSNKKASQENLGKAPQLKIRNRPQKETVSSFKSQDKSLNESAIGLNLVQNDSNVILQDDNVSFANPLRSRDFFRKNKGKRFSKPNSKSPQELKAQHSISISKHAISNQQWHIQQLDHHGPPIVKRQESNSTAQSNLPKHRIVQRGEGRKPKINFIENSGWHQEHREF